MGSPRTEKIIRAFLHEFDPSATWAPCFGECAFVKGTKAEYQALANSIRSKYDGDDVDRLTAAVAGSKVPKRLITALTASPLQPTVTPAPMKVEAAPDVPMEVDRVEEEADAEELSLSDKIDMMFERLDALEEEVDDLDTEGLKETLDSVAARVDELEKKPDSPSDAKMAQMLKDSLGILKATNLRMDEFAKSPAPSAPRANPTADARLRLMRR